ncbi:hypothetical protein [Alkalihalobacterium alkalinitrilicum]|uniref:hypothetical protein n=1 Tax=Alkalihalobacterium alkalinitrilicum TaxID=427920 RepID=UPI0009951C8D|nr:hypothetical protein [Alkalihalobacterium alkalinitrilicum]
MSVANFELWLDESGNFIDEQKKTGAPSIVGGMLVPVKKNNDQWASALVTQTREKYNIKERYIHGTELHGNKYGEMAVELLQKCIDEDARLIIFENEERIDIVNSDMTYLNILAEGIIQLLQTLAAEHEEIKLSILAANRVKVDGMQDRQETILIKDYEYKERLAEKIALSMARRNLMNGSNWNWSFQLDSAKSNPRLMLADVVCHSWFVQDGRKFTDVTRELLRNLYKPAFVFSVFEHATEAAIRRSLMAGTIGEALFEWLDAKTATSVKPSYVSTEIATTIEEDLDYSYYLQLIATKLTQIPEFAQATQLSIVENHVETLISIDRNFDKATRMLELIKHEVAPALAKAGVKEKRFFFKVYINLLKIANHRGNVILGSEQIEISRSLLDQLAGRWETIDDVIGYMILEGVHRMNTYDFQGTIDGMNKVQKFIDTSFELLSISLLEDLSLFSEDMKSNLKGKVLGTRLQARSFLIREDREQIVLARKDSDDAIEEFSTQSDLNRQYQYRCQIECEAKEPIEALKWLGKAFQTTYKSTNDLQTLMKKIHEARYIDQIFGAMHYSRALVSAYECNEFDLAERMYEQWVKSKIEQTLFSIDVKEHPYEIILWKHAYYLGKTNRLKAAIEKYDQAYKICNHSVNRYTLRSIGLGILFEKTSVLQIAGKKYSHEAKKALQIACKQYDEFMKEGLPEQLNSYFEQFKPTIENLHSLSEEDQSKILYTLSLKIPY